MKSTRKKFPNDQRGVHACLCVYRIAWSVLKRPLEKAVTFAKGTGVRSCLPMAPHCESIKLPPSDLKPSSLLHKRTSLPLSIHHPSLFNHNLAFLHKTLCLSETGSIAGFVCFGSMSELSLNEIPSSASVKISLPVLPVC